MDPILRRRTSILYGARSRAVSLAGRPLPANPHERYPLVYATVALADAVALRICATPGSVGWCPCLRFGPSWSATSAPGHVRTSTIIRRSRYDRPSTLSDTHLF